MTENDYRLLYDIAGKRITELEKENTELRDNYDQFKASAIPEIERLQKEKCELLGIIQEKDKVIEKMKCCGNCQHQYEGSYKNGIRCKDHLDEEVCDDWELKE